MKQVEYEGRRERDQRDIQLSSFFSPFCVWIKAYIITVKKMHYKCKQKYFKAIGFRLVQSISFAILFKEK